MRKGTGLGQRLAERIKAKGYAEPGAKFGIKVSEFAFDYRYREGSLFKWLGDVVTPDYEMMLRLAKDLETTPGWLHYGEGTPDPHPTRGKGKAPRKPVTAISGGSYEPPTPAPGDQVPHNRTLCGLSDVATRLRTWLASPMLPTLSPA